MTTNEDSTSKEITPETIRKIFKILASPIAAKMVYEILNEKIEQREKNRKEPSLSTLNSSTLKGLKVRRVTCKGKVKGRVYESEKYFVHIPLSLVRKLGLKDGDYVWLLKSEKITRDGEK